jgi:hypothetical protein
MNFYILENPETGETDAVTDFLPTDDFTTGEAPTCKACGRAVGMLAWEPPYKVEMRFWKKHHGDISFGTGDDLLVSERFRDLFLQRGLTGLYGFFPAEVVKVMPKRMLKGIPRYYVACIQRANAAIDAKASGFDREEGVVCGTCKGGGFLKSIKRVVLEEGTWQGEDVFIARGLPGTIITSRRFKQFCSVNAFKNILLMDALQYSFDYES